MRLFCSVYSVGGFGSVDGPALLACLFCVSFFPSPNFSSVTHEVSLWTSEFLVSQDWMYNHGGIWRDAVDGMVETI